MKGYKSFDAYEIRVAKLFSEWLKDGRPLSIEDSDVLRAAWETYEIITAETAHQAYSARFGDSA